MSGTSGTINLIHLKSKIKNSTFQFQGVIDKIGQQKRFDH